MNFKAYVERPIRSHAPELYRATETAESIPGPGAVDDAAIATYRERGFLLIRQAISADLVTRARRELVAMTGADDPDCESVHYEEGVRQRLGLDELAPEAADSSQLDDATLGALWKLPREVRRRSVRKFMGFVDRDHPPLAAVANDSDLLDAIVHLAGEPVRLFQDMALVKPPGGREKPWHQDHAYFNLPIATPVVAAWVALGEATPENGCMHLIPGGHRDGPLPHFVRRDWQLCDDEVEGERSVAAVLSAGDILLFDGKLPHGTPTNRTGDWRWALQFHYVPRSAVEVDESVRLAAFGGEGRGVTC